MTPHEIRKNRLLALIAAHDNNQRVLADAIGCSPAQISQIVVGERNMGERLARKIEANLHLPLRWMDELPAGVAETPAIYAPKQHAVLLSLWEQLPEQTRGYFLGLMRICVKPHTVSTTKRRLTKAQKNKGRHSA